MSAAHEWLASEAGWWWPRVADHLWQATLFALIVLAASFALKRAPARVRHCFWLLASAKFIVPTTLFVYLVGQAGVDSLWLFDKSQQILPDGFLLHGISDPVSMFANRYEVTVFGEHTVQHSEIYCVLTSIWLVGCLTLLAVWGMRRRKFIQTLKLGRSVQTGREWQALKRAQEALNLKTSVRLIISPQKTEPAVCRPWKPIVMLPESIAIHLDDAELEAIMLHELVHIQRRDNLIGNLQMALCAVLWFHPLVWFITRKLFDEREQACDEKVVEIYGAPEAYASSILKVVRFCFGWRVAGVTGAGGSSNLRRRIENIMSTSNSKRSAAPWPRLLASTAVGLALLIMVAAGVYNRARGASPEARGIQSERAANITTAEDGMNFLALSDELDQPAKKSRRARIQPPPPPPSQPSQSSQPSPPSQPRKTGPPPPRRTTAETPETSSDQPNQDSARKKDKGEVVKGALIEAPRPVYPPEARKQRIEGTVTVKIVIGEEGQVISARATSGPEPLHGASVEAAYKARFKPTIVDGKPAKVAGVMTYNFVAEPK